MAESSLSVTYADLMSGVGRFLGYDSDPSKWSSEQRVEIDQYVQAGVRQFYYPPAAQGVEVGYEWSFLNPVTEITTVADDGEQDLPEDLGRIQGNLYYENEFHLPPVRLISEGRILSLLSEGSSSTDAPKFAATRFKAQEEGEGQRKEILWWPVPSDAWTLKYQYEAFAGRLSARNKYPLGGMKFSGVIIESCLSIAEQRANDERGAYWERFVLSLIAAISQDKKNGAAYFGSMGDPVPGEFQARRPLSGSYPLTYKGVTW